MGTAFDFAPLFRSTIGFDRLAHLLESSSRLEEAHGYPPYNIEKVSDDAYRISLAVAGFSEDDLNIEFREGSLIVTGEQKGDGEEHAYLHRGIAARSFRRTFQLADFVRVTDARLEHGLLSIELVRELPEAMKPRKIEISDQAKAPKRIETPAKKAA